MRAYVAVREQPCYRRDAFLSGLQACGYELGPEQVRPKPGDLALVWCRYGDTDRLAKRYEAAGATVVVSENGYLGREWRGKTWYALALNQHNGVGRWPVGETERTWIFDRDWCQWRSQGGYALVFAQRGIGSPLVAQPPGWHQKAAQLLERMGHRVVVRGHPGRHQENESLYPQLDGAAFAVTWGSGAAIKALLYGVPVYHGLPQWIGAPAARPFGKALGEPYRGDRTDFLTRLAWAMWSVEEIGSGYAFRHLLRGSPEAVQQGPVQRTG